MMTDFFIVGFVFIVIGLLLILRAMGVVQRSSPFFRYRIRLGGVLVFVGLIITVLSIIL
jgi:hypothetical protein